MQTFVQSLDIQPGDINGIVLHWTGGAPSPNTLDIKHYNALIDQFLKCHKGKFSADDNIDVNDGFYAAHTLHANTKRFGLSLCGMLNAKENVSFGTAPITEGQFNLAAKLVAHILRAAGLPCQPHTICTHSEVPTVLGVPQKGKWDINVLPWRSDLKGAKPIGDHFRKLVQKELDKLSPVVKFAGEASDLLRIGSKGAKVGELQEELTTRNYSLGRIDEDFGKRTRSALLAFQADNGLKPTGETDAETWAALRRAPDRGKRPMKMADLRKAGSRTIKGADSLQMGAVGFAGLGSLSEVINNFGETEAMVTEATSLVSRLQILLDTNWQTILFLGAGYLAYYLAGKIKTARLDDAVTGVNDGR